MIYFYAKRYLLQNNLSLFCLVSPTHKEMLFICYDLHVNNNGKLELKKGDGKYVDFLIDLFIYSFSSKLM